VHAHYQPGLNASAIWIMKPNELRSGCSFLSRIGVKEFADEGYDYTQLYSNFLLPEPGFAFSIGILSTCSWHLTFAGCGNGAWLDRLSVRCLSSYLFLPLFW
jgi:hypothetical protein